MSRHIGQEGLVFGFQGPVAVQHLQDANNTAAAIYDRDALDIPRLVSQEWIELRIETIIGIGILGINGLAVLGDNSGDP